MTHPRRLSSVTRSAGRFLQLDQLEFMDHKGRARTWEAAQRRHGQGAVQMLPLLQPSGRCVLIQQYRPPLDAYVLEFPAGLIDPGETPSETAVRELREETGYSGRVTWLSAPTCTSPGMSGETVVLALMEIAETAPENHLPQQVLDEEEQIEVFLVPRPELADFLAEKARAGVSIDSRTAAYALGLGLRW